MHGLLSRAEHNLTDDDLSRLSNGATEAETLGNLSVMCEGLASLIVLDKRSGAIQTQG